MRKTALFLLVMVAACKSDPASVVPEPNIVVHLAEDFLLAPGDVAALPAAGLSVRFDEVTEDSRCPTDVDCVWEGRGAVALMAVSGDGVERRVELEVRQPPQALRLGGYAIEVIDLSPAPRSTSRIPASDYRITLRIVADTTVPPNPAAG